MKRLRKVIAYHVSFGAYGFWLPNDPRGSWSDYVRSQKLLKHGPATKTNELRSLARDPHDHAKRQAAKRSLQHQPVRFSGIQARAIGRGFAAAVEKSEFTVHACAIMPDHVHLVVARHSYKVEQIVRRFKALATERLREEGLCPEGTASPWARSCWKVFLYDEEAIRRATKYVEMNPVRDGLPPQKWAFVTPFEGQKSGELNSPA